MPNVLVRDVPATVLATLKRRAASNHRSLQQELLVILEEASASTPMEAAAVASAIQERLKSRGIAFADSTSLIRDDRDR